MAYKTVLENMQATDRAFRVCLGGAQYKQVKKLERKALALQNLLLSLRDAILSDRENIKKVGDLYEKFPHFRNDEEVIKRLKNINEDIQNAYRHIGQECGRSFKELQKILSNKAGARELYGRAMMARTTYVREHLESEAATVDSIFTKTAECNALVAPQVREIDRLMAESDYRNQAGITFADFEVRQRELYALDLILDHYTEAASINLPECEVMKSTPMWKYVGVGKEVVEVRIEELRELQERFQNVDGVMLLIEAVQMTRAQYAAKREAATPMDAGDEGGIPVGEMAVTAALQPRSMGKVVGDCARDEKGVLHPVIQSSELLSVSELNPFAGQTDASRQHMFEAPLTDAELEDKLKAATPGGADNFLATWTGRETPEVDVQLGGAACPILDEQSTPRGLGAECVYIDDSPFQKHAGKTLTEAVLAAQGPLE